MPLQPVELTLEIQPGARFDLIDVRQQASAHRKTLEKFPQSLYCSFHTTAGYLDQGLASRLNQARLGIGPYIGLFQALFPEGAGYRHDDLHLRDELSADQKIVEPRNADAHLAFIAAGLCNCVRYVNRRNEPVHFVDLDGINGDQPRKRQTSILAFNVEEVVVRVQIRVPVSQHPLESVNLKDSRLGLYERLHELIGQHGVSKGRVHLSLAAGEHQAGLTINEYETLLMRHDLIEVLRNPLRFVAEKGRHLLENPWAIPNKTIGYAKYDLVRLLNETFDALHMNESLMETLLARLIGAPARRFLRMKRSVSLLVSDRENRGRGLIADGTYQSPILVQWQKAAGRQRVIDVTLTRLA
jgi:thiamine phosphate synthase YjbQ (UPF0047 family)